MLTGTHQFPALDHVVYGADFIIELKTALERLDPQAVYVLASGTLARQTDALDRLRATLRNRLAGVCTQIGAHTPRPDVVAAANQARSLRADLLVTLGGGSVTDAAKMIGLCLGNDVTEPGQLDAFRAHVTAGGATRRPTIRPPGVRSIAIPTTLSAGEYTWFAGCTDPVRHLKESYGHPLMVPQIVVLDPTLSRHTPEWLFLSTGMRAVDHAVETICAAMPQPMADAAALHALRLLGRGLRAVKAQEADLDARGDCQVGGWLSTTGGQSGVPMGASHGIGHVLGGTAGVPHGYTSCVMLPHVLRFNAGTSGDRQAQVSEALGRPGLPAGDAVAELVTALGLPGRLRDVGVKKDQLDRLAGAAMHDRWIHTNPRRIDGPAVVQELLEAAF